MLEQFAQAVEPWLVGAVAAVFGALATVALVRARRFGRAGWWAGAMFASMAIYLCGSWLSSALSADAPIWLGRVLLGILVLFPFLMLRFAASFRGLPKWVERAAAVTAAALALSATFVPEGGTEAAPWVALYLVVILAYWIVLSLIAATRLWQAGRGQPTVARRRMRLMSIGTIVLAMGLLLSGLSGDGNATADVVVMSVVLASAVILAVGFTPPRSLVLAWRKVEDQQLRQAVMDVLRATTPQDVAVKLLPAVCGIVGGAGTALLDSEHRVLASYGRAPSVGTLYDTNSTNADDAATKEIVPVGADGRRLVVWASRYTPFFAREELELIQTMGAFANLALERSELLAQERDRREALQRAGAEAEHARDEADRANTAKTDFLSRMSHELRTPLNAILGFGQLLQTSTLSPEDQQAAGHILKAGQHLLALINDVLDLSRVEAGMMTVSLEPVQIADLIDDTLRLIQPSADARSISLAHSTDDCDAYAKTDRQRCRQILLNFLSNAVKYNHDGGQVSVDCHHIDASTLRIAVTDTGPGIAPDRQQRLFEPFDRLGAESTGVEGTGLGLALTKQLAEHLGGSIGVQTAPGSGSTFWVDLPSSEPPTDDAATPAVDNAHEKGAATQTLLLVEDNLANLELVQAMLRRRPNLTVEAVMQGTLASEIASQLQPDVIVLDLHLPDVPGREVLARLRADPATRDIPIIIASADATPRRIHQLQEEGAFAYLAKPLDINKFLKVIDAALNEHNSMSAFTRP